jgi:MarR family transcriptional regulator, organic hydroperoxide resistance regulator
MYTENELVIQNIVGAIRRLSRAVYLDAFRASRQFGLTRSQAGVLKNLSSRGPLSSAALSRKMYMTPSNMTGIIDRLEKKGFIARTRQPEDRRVVLIMLTDAGREISLLLPESIEKKLVSGLSELTPEQIQPLSKSMYSILGLMDALDIEDTPLEINNVNASTSPDQTFE